MVNLVTDSTNEKSLPLLGRVTLLTEHAVIASPVLLKGKSIALWVWKTEWVEAFTAKVAAEEVFFVTK